MSCGAWLWQPTTRVLRDAGHDVRSLTLPGLGFDDGDLNPSLADATRAIVEAVESWTDEPVTIVAHSGSGIAATGAAFTLGPSRVHEIIYYAAVVPENRRSMSDEFGAPRTDQPPVSLPLSRSDIDVSLMPEASEPVRSLVYGLLTPTPGRYFYDQPTFPSTVKLPIKKRYLWGTDDLAFAKTSERFASRIGVPVETVPGSHLGMLTHPHDIAAAITSNAS